MCLYVIRAPIFFPWEPFTYAIKTQGGNQSERTSLPRKLEMAFLLLWLFLLVAWSAILIGLVFTFRVNHHHCEMCRSTTLCRSVPSQTEKLYNKVKSRPNFSSSTG